MGFFSKLTADTNESIPSIYAAASKPVYLLQPNGLPPIKESAYEGYGVIDQTDWFVWLATMNAEHLGFNPKDYSEEELRNIGISLDCGDILQHTETGEYWSVFHDHRIASNQPDVKYFKGTYSDVIPEFGKSANELAKEGVFKAVYLKEINKAPYSIKLSHNPNARYEDLPASKDCPHQGFFYPNEMIDSGNMHVSDEDCAG